MRGQRRIAALALAIAVLTGSGSRGDAVVRVSGMDRPLAALTFDDGPGAETGRLLDALASRGVPATFFLIGALIPGREALVRRMEAEGHQVGTHSYDHVRLTGLDAAGLAAQVDRTEDLLESILGHSGYPLRPPYGAVDRVVERGVSGPIILWSVDPEDWRTQDAGAVAEHIIANCRDGDVILLHDIYPSSVDAALLAVDALHRRGFLFVTVEELARQRHRELSSGMTYRDFYQ